GHMVKYEAFGLNCRSSVHHPRRNVDLEAGLARRSRHRQTMRQKIPVFGDDVEQARQAAPVHARGLHPEFAGSSRSRAASRQATPARKRSWKWMRPTGLSPSTTNRAVIFELF